MPRVPTLLFALFAASPLAAQCALDWAPGAPSGGPSGRIDAVLTLPNGDVVAGGLFPHADGAIVNNIARWDGTTWRALAGGSNGTVWCLARMPNGDVVAAGAFTTMGGTTCNRIARWNGTTWSPLGAGFDNSVFALLVLPNGDLVAGGQFGNSGTTPIPAVARWNGTAWSALGTSLPTGICAALAQRPNGDVYAGGAFFATNDPALLVWNGVQWTTVPAFDPFSYPNVRDLATLANGDLAISGTFTIGGLSQTLAVWNGTTSQPLTPPIGTSERALLRAANGDLLVASTAQQPQQVSLARWNGTAWTPVPGAPPLLRALAEDATGRLVTGGNLSGVVPRGSPVARFDGTTWQILGAPAPALPQAMLTLPGGDVVVGGSFTSFGGVAANSLARWNGSTWAPLGLGVDGPVRSLALAPNGDVVVSGTFQNAGGQPANRIARWNGQVWSTLGGGLNAEATSLAVVPGGAVYAAAPTIGLQEFRNGQWSALNIAGAVAAPLALATLANGDLAISSVFPVAGTTLPLGLARYDGTNTTLVPNSPIGIVRMLVAPDGTLFSASANGIRSWDGLNWTLLLQGNAQALALLPNGDLLGAGPTQTMAGSTTPSALFRQTANGWVNFGAVQGGTATCLAVSERGDILAGGSFTTVAGAVSHLFTQATPTCPATTQFVGSGCSGGAGPVTLAAESLPWAGAAFRAEATGMTSNSLALQLIGLQPASGPLPGGAPGCSLWVTPILVGTLLPAGGVADASFVVPNDPGLGGFTFRLQVVGIELGATGIVRLTSSNALAATIGVL